MAKEIKGVWSDWVFMVCACCGEPFDPNELPRTCQKCNVPLLLEGNN